MEATRPIGVYGLLLSVVVAGLAVVAFQGYAFTIGTGLVNPLLSGNKELLQIINRA
jgi:hypothetical protein